MSIMFAELNEAEQVVEKAIRSCSPVASEIAQHCRDKNLGRIIVAGRGSSLNAGIGFKFYVETQTAFTVGFEYPSVVTLYHAKRDLSDALYVVISQSGAGPDTIEMTKAAIKNGATVVSVTNGVENPVSKLCKFNLNISSGTENAVAATKTFTGELAALFVLAEALAGNSVPSDFAKAGIRFALNMPADVPSELVKATNAIVLSRGLTEVVAKECSLKLMETCYMYAFSYSTNEFQHGPKALIARGTPVVVFAPDGRCKDNFVNTVKDLKDKGAFLIVFSDSNDFAESADSLIKMPSVSEAETAIVYTVKMQQFVAALCEKKGLSPDNPRNLNKVTITK